MNPAAPAACRIVGFDRRWRGDFARLNLEWLRRWFVVEPVDEEVLADPETHILAGGGGYCSRCARRAAASARWARWRCAMTAAASTN